VTDFTAVNATLAPVTQNGTEKYIKVTSSGTTARTGVFPVGGTFPVVAGEKYRIRVKGYRTGASAAYIQAKASGGDIIWPGAAIASSAASESWTEQTVTIPSGATTLQVGVNWNTVTNGEIMYVNEIEITKLSTGTPEYQYHLKDHLGNVRTTFTTVTSVDQNTATLEDANLNVEQSQFVRVTTAKRVYATIFDKTNGASPGYSERLNGSANEKYGIAKSISVMPGDVIQAQVYGKYVDQNSSNWTGALATLMGQIATNPTGVVFDGASYSSSTTSFPSQWLPYVNTSGSTGGPKAYLNWLIFDRDYNFITGGYQRMSSAPMEQGQDVAHELLSSPSITATQAGYVYIYLSNEETSPVEVYFDDFKVTYTKSPVVQVDDYYPFGLSISALSYQRENSVVNDFLYNGKEKQTELGLDWYDYGARMYMADIGRWAVVDPLSEKYQSFSPYNYTLNDPVKHIDPDGRFVGTLIGAIVGGAAGAIDAYRNDRDVLAGATEGAVSGAIAGAIVDLTVATGGGAAVVIGAAALGGAIGNAAGDLTGQVVTSVNRGDNLSTAVSNVNFANTGSKALTGAVTGVVGGAVGAGVGKVLAGAANSTKAVQATMTKNINETAKTLNGMGASASTTQKAMGKIADGMGQAGRNTANSIATTTMVTEGAIKTAEVIDPKKKPN